MSEIVIPGYFLAMLYKKYFERRACPLMDHELGMVGDNFIRCTTRLYQKMLWSD
jgi:hypothetical protein